MNGIIVLGAGGHAKVCIEVLHSMGEKVDYCIASSVSVEKCLNVPVLGGDDSLERLRMQGYSRAFVAVGSNRLREQLAKLCIQLGFSMVNAISPSSIISSSAHLGHGIAIMPGVIINAETIISDLVIINTAASIDHDCRIGLAVHIGPQCALAGNVRIGDRAFLGIGVKVIPHININEDVIVGAGGVVISDVPPGVTAVGIPARSIKEPVI